MLIKPNTLNVTQMLKTMMKFMVTMCSLWPTPRADWSQRGTGVLLMALKGDLQIVGRDGLKNKLGKIRVINLGG